jgi:hypothetical protein
MVAKFGHHCQPKSSQALRLPPYKIHLILAPYTTAPHCGTSGTVIDKHTLREQFHLEVYGKSIFKKDRLYFL